VSGEEAAIDAELRAVFAGLADVLIPAGEGMPSAGEVALERGALDAVLAVRPDVTDDLVALLEAARETDPAAEVERLRAEDEGGFGLLTTVVGGGYFLDEGVREAIGYRGQEAVPIEHLDPPDYERDGLLASVVERGPVYRPTPRS
jgi:hypothetical protein